MIVLLVLIEWYNIDCQIVLHGLLSQIMNLYCLFINMVSLKITLFELLSLSQKIIQNWNFKPGKFRVNQFFEQKMTNVNLVKNNIKSLKSEVLKTISNKYNILWLLHYHKDNRQLDTQLIEKKNHVSINMSLKNLQKFRSKLLLLHQL